MSDEEKIIHLSDEELEALKFLGDAAPQPVIDFVGSVKNSPDQFEWLTIFQLQCLSDQLKYHPTVPDSPTSPTSEAATLVSSSKTTIAESGLVSLFERIHFYTGISDDPPPLLHRSDILEHPFVIPPDRHHTAIPEKTAHGVVHPVFKNKLWKEKVAPEIIAMLKEEDRGIRVTTMVPVRFSTPNENGQDVLDKHFVIWISVRPNSTKETACRDTNAPILAILAKYNIHDAALHWIEGAVEPLAGAPPMMRVAKDTDPTHYIRRALTAVLGVPIQAEELAGEDAQGSLGLYFHEGKNKKGEKSDRVLALTNKHVTTKDTAKDYEYSGRPGAPQKYIRNCGARRFQQVVNETRALIAKKLGDAKLFAEQLAELMAKPKSNDADEAAEDEENLERKQTDLKRAEKDVGTLGDFLKLLNSTWSDAYQRIIGHLDWAPKIANDLDQRCYTRDLAAFVLDPSKFEKHFKGNSVYLAGKYSPDEIKSFFYPNAANAPSFKYPSDHLFRLLDCVDPAGLANPYYLDDQGNPCFIVAKDGQATDLTFGRCSGLEAYRCDDLDNESWEVAIFNFSKKNSNFSGKGDSGSAIFNSEGKIIAILHSGMPRGMSNHVTFGTPGHYVVELIKKQYPHADFARTQFTTVAA